MLLRLFRRTPELSDIEADFGLVESGGALVPVVKEPQPLICGEASCLHVFENLQKRFRMDARREIMASARHLNAKRMRAVCLKYLPVQARTKMEVAEALTEWLVPKNGEQAFPLRLLSEICQMLRETSA